MDRNWFWPSCRTTQPSPSLKVYTSSSLLSAKVQTSSTLPKLELMCTTFWHLLASTCFTMKSTSSQSRTVRTSPPWSRHGIKCPNHLHPVQVQWEDCLVQQEGGVELHQHHLLARDRIGNYIGNVVLFGTKILDSNTKANTITYECISLDKDCKYKYITRLFLTI